ncbi:Sterile alpha motif domain containing protein 9 [Dissostichus eleginoides]|uniref:Sterile alpha motif domain containing protein 9 n=1 Tax=Dissostichus eleginoides TaxID=100907 RepID=A0AAD9F9G4_DISEL|nr:Sterile alpha motif domain containing protein 9 [Dissostichus eleginoides]
MSQSSTEEPPELNMWTKEDVHQWLMNVVKVPQSCADLFLEHEINGEALNEIEKSYILKLELPHGPAVKISHYLERLKKGSQHQPQFQSEAENWTKEKVAQWIVGHGKVSGKKAERFQEEEVSGDCLVCFEKQDFLDLELKRGPTIKILKDLRRLRIQESTPPSKIKSFLKGKNKQAGKNLPMERKTTEVKCQKPAPLIKDNLDGLSTSDFNNFKFHLNHYTDPECTAIPLCKLEGKDTSDIATVVTSHYGPDKALRETKLKIL